MAGRAGQKIKLTSIDELLCVPETEGTVDIDVRAIYPFENHPFKVLDDEKMDELVESIKANGVLTPVLVRPDDEGTYEMISGHRRLHAAKKAGLLAMGMTQEELADILCTKKSTISAYELGKNDVKVGILKEMAPVLGTTVAYLAGGEACGFSPEVMQIAMLLEGMQNKELRRVAMEQVKLLAGVSGK